MKNIKDTSSTGNPGISQSGTMNVYSISQGKRLITTLYPVIDQSHARRLYRLLKRYTKAKFVGYTLTHPYADTMENENEKTI